MELWIRSQDRTTLAKIDKISLYAAGGNINCNGELFAHYETRERALEVLDEIQNIIRGKYAISLDMEAALSKNISQKEAEQMLMQMAVYEMPQE